MLICEWHKMYLNIGPPYNPGLSQNGFAPMVIMICGKILYFQFKNLDESTCEKVFIILKLNQKGKFFPYGLTTRKLYLSMLTKEEIEIYME